MLLDSYDSTIYHRQTEATSYLPRPMPDGHTATITVSHFIYDAPSGDVSLANAAAQLAQLYAMMRMALTRWPRWTRFHYCRQLPDAAGLNIDAMPLAPFGQALI